jgi:hypothetical protein
MHRGGALDPGGSDLQLAIGEVTLELRLDAAQATLEALTLPLADVDVPPSPQLPDGLKLRRMQLTARAPVAAQILQRSDRVAQLRVPGALTLHASLLLPDGILYPLGGTDTAASDLDVAVTAEGQGGWAVALEAQPADTCWSLDGLLSLTRCALHVTTAATLTAL